MASKNLWVTSDLGVVLLHGRFVLIFAWHVLSMCMDVCDYVLHNFVFCPLGGFDIGGDS